MRLTAAFPCLRCRIIHVEAVQQGALRLCRACAAQTPLQACLEGTHTWRGWTEGRWLCETCGATLGGTLSVLVEGRTLEASEY